VDKSVDNLWISANKKKRLCDPARHARQLTERLHFRTSLSHFGASAITLALHFCTLAPKARPCGQKLIFPNENDSHSHLKIFFKKVLTKTETHPKIHL